MIKFIVDTGADVTVINRGTAQRLGLDMRPTRRDFRGADGNKLEIHFKAYLPLISAWGQEVRGKAYILEGARNNLLGKPEIRKFKLVKTIMSISEEIELKHPKLFGKLGVLPDVFKIKNQGGCKSVVLERPTKVTDRIEEGHKG